MANKELKNIYNSNEISAVDKLNREDPVIAYVHRKFPSIGVDVIKDVEMLSSFGSEGSNGYMVFLCSNDHRIIYPIHDIYKIELNPEADDG